MNVRLRVDMPFMAGVYYANEMRMNHYNLRVWMLTNTSEAENHNVAFERIKYFVYNVMESVIFINTEHADKCQQFVNAGLKISTMPGEPVDQLLGIMLYHKLNAITEDYMIVEEVEISSALGDHVTYLHSANELTNLNNFPSWWTTPDVVYYDTDLIDSDKIVPMHQNSVWRELNLSWSTTASGKDTDNTVVFANFTRDDDSK